MKKILFSLLFFNILMFRASAQEQTGAIWGKLTDELSGDVVERATVTLISNSFPIEQPVFSDKNGEFRIYGLRPEKYDLLIYASSISQPLKILDVPVHPLENTKLEIRISSEGNLTQMLIVPYEELIMNQQKKRRKRKRI